MPRSANVEYYARIVKEKSTLRSLIHSANKILTEAYEAEQEPDLLLDEAERSIFAIAEDRIRAGFVPLRDLVQSSFATIEALQQHKGLVTGVPTGFLDLDEMTSGLQRSDLVLVAARPSMGKTSFVLNIAQHVGTSTNMTVGFFSLEMSKEQLFMRLLTSEARIDAHRFRSGYLSEKDYGRLSQALGTLAEAKVFIDDTASIGVLEMRAKARRLKAEHGLDLLIIDYIQLMQGRGRFESRQAEIASISRSLKGLAKELNVPIVALSQLSRASETRSDHRPQLSDLRESGALEQDADVVMFIYREEQYRDADGNTNQDAEGTAEIIIGKQRNGPIGTAKLAFIKEHTRFENLAPGQGPDKPSLRAFPLTGSAASGGPPFHSTLPRTSRGKTRPPPGWLRPALGPQPSAVLTLRARFCTVACHASPRSRRLKRPSAARGATVRPGAGSLGASRRAAQPDRARSDSSRRLPPL